MLPFISHSYWSSNSLKQFSHTHFNRTRHLLRVMCVLRYSSESVFAWRAVRDNLRELLKITYDHVYVRSLLALNYFSMYVLHYIIHPTSGCLHRWYLLIKAHSNKPTPLYPHVFKSYSYLLHLLSFPFLLYQVKAGRISQHSANIHGKFWEQIDEFFLFLISA